MRHVCLYISDPDFSCGTGRDGPTEGSTRGPRGPKNTLYGCCMDAVLSHVIMRMTWGGLLVWFPHIWVSYSPQSIQLVHKRSLVSLITPFALLLRPLMVIRLLQPALRYFQIYGRWLRSTVGKWKVPQNLACSSLLQISWKNWLSRRLTIDLLQTIGSIWRLSFRFFFLFIMTLITDVGCGSLSW